MDGADPARVGGLLDELAALSRRDDATGIWRIAFSDAELAARRRVITAARDIGLDARVDGFANLHFTLPGRDASLPPLGVGSHLDSVPGGGNLDGAAGVVIALEAARLLAGAGLSHAVRIVVFTGEEAGPFGVSTIGSRGLADTLSDRELALRDGDGHSLARRIDHAVADSELPSLDEPPAFAAFVEVHIEQGNRLDRAGLPLAVVEGITAIRRLRIRLDGEANHAGTTVRSRRHDALLAAAEFLSAAEIAWARLDPDEKVSLTFGRIDVYPNAINVIPAQVALVCELRCPDAGLLDRLHAEVTQLARDVAVRRMVDLEIDSLSDQPPRSFDGAVIAALTAACEQRGVQAPLLWSLAGHDAGHVGLTCPAGMLFVRTVGGISHAPGEHAEPQDLALATDAVAAALLELDRQE